MPIHRPYALFSRLLRRPTSPQRPGGLLAPATLSLESLEARTLLAGNVSVDFLGDGIRLSGDQLGNDVEVSVTSGNIVLTGKNNTTINGASAPLNLRTGATQINGSLFAFLGDGDDKLVLRGAFTIGDHLKIFAGSGNDVVGIENLTVQDNLLVIAGDGNDQIAMRTSELSGNVRLDLGSGDDTVSAQSITGSDRFEVDGGGGADAIVLEQMTIDGLLMLRLGRGNDTASLVRSTIRGNVKAPTGLSDDFILVDESTIDGKLKVVGSRDDDSVVLRGNTTIRGKFKFDAGSGSDGFQTASSVTINGKNVQLNIEASTVPANLITQRLDDPQFGANSRAQNARSAAGLTPLTPLNLTISTSSNNTVASHATLLTKDSSFTITGTTLAGARVEIARDGDSIFNDGSVFADASGNFTIDVTLTHTLANRGENPIVVRATDSFSRTATQSVTAHLVVGTVVRMTTNLGPVGNREFIDLELLDTDAPTFVANFKNYFADYANSIVHRKQSTVPNGLGIIQGGGFVLSSANVNTISADPPIANNFNNANLNVRGSISMARPGIPGNLDTATSQWFINTANNATLDTQQFTVFGHVIPSSLTVVDQIAAFPATDVADLTGISAFTDIPLRSYTQFTTTLGGTVATTAGSTSVTGTGTTFTTSIPADNQIMIGTQVFTVANIVSNTQLTLTTAASTTAATQTAKVNSLPTEANYVLTSTVAELSVPN